MMMTDNDIKIVLELLHKRILHSKIAEEVTEAEIMALVEVVDRINRQKAEVELKEMDVNSLTSERDALQEMVSEQKAEIERKTTECERLEIYMDELVKQELKQAKSEAIKEFADKITEVFLRYAHLHSYAEQARKDYIETVEGQDIEMQSVWDVITLQKNGIAEYEEMSRLQKNIETIEKERLLTELEKDFRLLLKEMESD